MLTAISFVVVLSLLVFVHELGHFVVAKRAGVKVEEFGFGYPLPNGLLTITLFKRGETVYTLNPIPFGGFVRMAGEEDPDAERGLASKSKLVRVGVLLAGSGMNVLLGIVFFILCFMVGGWCGHGAPHVSAQQLDFLDLDEISSFLIWKRRYGH